MKRFFVDEKLEVNEKIKIEGIEHNHIKNVMRMKVGDEIILVCGDEFDYYATIVSISKGDTEVFVHSKLDNENNPKANLTVFQALVKSDNMSLIVQKLTELGVKTFVPFESEFITSKDKLGKVHKLQEISNQSIKQCKRSIPMKVEDIISFSKLVEKVSEYDIVLFANETEKNLDLSSLDIQKDSNTAIIIGSEGGFSCSEVEKLISAGAKSISLGKRILRAETASIALSSVIICKLGEWDCE